MANKQTIIPIILSGGVGSRLWPHSRENHPKPFIRLSDGQSLIQKTYIRMKNLLEPSEILTVTNNNLFFYTHDEYEETRFSVKKTYLLEPFSRNTAGAIALAGHYVKKKYGNEAVIMVSPADHLIENEQLFKKNINEACKLALQDKLVTFGIKPHSPETGYGYIHAEGNNVKRFVEKPSLEKAKEYLISGNYFWNAGLFCMKVSTLLNELLKYAPDIYETSKYAYEKSLYSSNENFERYEISKKNYEKVRDISIDFAIFEKSNNLAIVHCDFDWSDVGSWIEFGKLSKPDSNYNLISGDTILKDTKNCIIHGSKKLIAMIGIEDVVVADTSDALLISKKSASQRVKEIFFELKNSKSPLYKTFPTVYRPWGKYTVIDEYNNFKIKLIEVKPKQKLSLQMHNKRSEHWVIVSGTAVITLEDKEFNLKTNQSFYIPTKARHRLENSSEEILVVVEVQIGEYLGEDDIVRFEDSYGRNSKKKLK